MYERLSRDAIQGIGSHSHSAESARSNECYVYSSPALAWHFKLEAVGHDQIGIFGCSSRKSDGKIQIEAPLGLLL